MQIAAYLARSDSTLTNFGITVMNRALSLPSTVHHFLHLALAPIKSHSSIPEFAIEKQMKEFIESVETASKAAGTSSKTRKRSKKAAQEATSTSTTSYEIMENVALPSGLQRAAKELGVSESEVKKSIANFKDSIVTSVTSTAPSGDRYGPGFSPTGSIRPSSWFVTQLEGYMRNAILAMRNTSYHVAGGAFVHSEWVTEWLETHWTDVWPRFFIWFNFGRAAYVLFSNLLQETAALFNPWANSIRLYLLDIQNRVIAAYLDEEDYRDVQLLDCIDAVPDASTAGVAAPVLITIDTSTNDAAQDEEKAIARASLSKVYGLLKKNAFIKPAVVKKGAAKPRPTVWEEQEEAARARYLAVRVT